MASVTEKFQDFARERRADLLGIAPVGRFDAVDAQHHPCSIFPECKSVVVVGKRIPRGALRGNEEGTQFSLYDMFGRDWLADRMLAITTIALATYLEDNRFEAVPLQDLPRETPPSGVAVKEGAPRPNVMVDVNDAAIRAGLGEYGYSGEFLSPRFGPRQRFQLILTDAVLEPTPLLEERVCDECGECATACPLGAFTGGSSTISVCGKQMEVADVDFDVCRNCRNGARPNGKHAAGKPDRIAALCTRTCLHHLEKSSRIENVFVHPFRARPAWCVDATGKPGLSSLQGGVK